ncbi:MAG: CorA family divalent cation transporter [Flavobacterium circumlabens]|uniref:Magnesium and cobalt transport protein n=1 Tax=Flavobacterium circumlabens TaxID=2133765 RepID=A0A4Y7U7A1_9FLAO|nr:CorA family divalent cation transporter [Flavobacterium circumlabens]TCN53140.1 magnesium transporter [Flavobacterium circumlabens]TEB42313.1 magnesium and cobalt transport protein [Flavobacterium circumlabens]
MIIELLDKDKNIIQLKSIDEIPEDLSNINSLQIINYKKSDIATFEKLFTIDTTILSNSDDIEISSHYLEKESQLAFNFSFPYFTAHNKIEEVIVSFILKEEIMFSFMDINFEQFIPENKRQEHFDKIKNLPFTINTFLLMMIGIVPDYFADLTEIISKNIKTMYSSLQKENDFSEYGLNEITALKFNNLLVKESLNEFRRILHLLRKSTKLSPEIKETILLELSDLTVINEYVQNNFERLDDLKDYIATKIDLEQNRIFKTLTIITMCISLPMLVAGIYGMNFKNMPELEWEYGYFYAIALILICFIVPLIWFKRKKWLQ